jgi:hypothetical protein
MLQNSRKSKGATGGLILAGLAAFAYYKYSKMSQEEKTKLTSDLKDKGQKLYDQYMPAQVKDMFAQKGSTNPNNTFDESSVYSS